MVHDGTRMGTYWRYDRNGSFWWHEWGMSFIVITCYYINIATNIAWLGKLHIFSNSSAPYVIVNMDHKACIMITIHFFVVNNCRTNGRFGHPTIRPSDHPSRVNVNHCCGRFSSIVPVSPSGRHLVHEHDVFAGEPRNGGSSAGGVEIGWRCFTKFWGWRWLKASWGDNRCGSFSLSAPLVAQPSTVGIEPVSTNSHPADLHKSGQSEISRPLSWIFTARMLESESANGQISNVNPVVYFLLRSPDCR